MPPFFNVPRPSQNSNDSHTFLKAPFLVIPGFTTPQTILFLHLLSPKDPKPVVPRKGADLGVVLPFSHLTALACVHVRRNELGSATIVIIQFTSSISFLSFFPSFLPPLLSSFFIFPYSVIHVINKDIIHIKKQQFRRRV